MEHSLELHSWEVKAEAANTQQAQSCQWYRRAALSRISDDLCILPFRSGEYNNSFVSLRKGASAKCPSLQTSNWLPSMH